MYQLTLILHVLIAISLVILVLVQVGKGAGMASSFGAGVSGTVFGSQGSGGFLFKCTCVFAAVFYITSLALSYFVAIENKKNKEQIIPHELNIPTE